MKTSPIRFRREIRTRMKEKNINIPKLARLAELNSQTLYNYFGGKSELTSGNLEKVLFLLNFKSLS